MLNATLPLFKQSLIKINHYHYALVIVLNALLGFCFFGYFARDLGYGFDDYVILAHARVDTIQDVANQFMLDARDWFEEESLDWWFFRYVRRVRNFMNAQYRPLAYLPMAIFNKLYHDNAFAPYLFSVFLHICNSVFLYYFFCLVFPRSLSYGASLYFLFHSSVSWITVIATMHDVQQLFLLCVTLVLYRKYLASRRFIFKVLAGLSYFSVLLTKEFLIFFPFLVVLYHILFDKSEFIFSFRGIRTLLLKTSQFFIGLVGYFCLKMFLFGFALDATSMYVSPLIRHGFKARIWSYSHNLKILLNMLFLDYLNPRYLPWALLPIAVFALSCFFYSTHKKRLIFLGLVMVLLSWPSWFFAIPGSRYLYTALPVFIALVMYLVLDFYSKKRDAQIFLFSFFGISLLYSTSILCRDLRSADFFTSRTTQAARQLASLVKTVDSGRASVLLAAPNAVPWQEAMRVVLGDKQFSFGEITKLPLEMFETNFLLYSRLNVSPQGDGFRFSSTNHENLFVSLACKSNTGAIILDNGSRFVDRFVIHDASDKGTIFDYSVVFKKDHPLWKRNPQFIAWDNMNKVFYKLNE